MGRGDDVDACAEIGSDVVVYQNWNFTFVKGMLYDKLIDCVTRKSQKLLEFRPGS